LRRERGERKKVRKKDREKERVSKRERERERERERVRVLDIFSKKDNILKIVHKFNQILVTREY